jgi:hypothetical protein
MMHEEIGLKVDPHPLHEPLLNILVDRVTYCIKTLVAYIYLSIITTQFPGTTSSKFMMVFGGYSRPTYDGFYESALPILSAFYKKANYSPGSSKTDGPIYKRPTSHARVLVRCRHL